MIGYMLDTDISSYFINGSHPRLTEKMLSLGWDPLCISAIVKSELLFGVEVSPRKEKEAAGVNQYLGYITILDFPAEAAQDYASIRENLKTGGNLISSNDMFIAAHARHLGLILVTNNVREFSRVPGLTIENWADAA